MKQSDGESVASSVSATDSPERLRVTISWLLLAQHGRRALAMSAYSFDKS